MAQLKRLQRSDLEPLLSIVQAEQPFSERSTLESMNAVFSNYEGWGIWSGDGVLIGAITLDGWVPFLSATLNTVIRSDYRGRWMNLAMLREVFGYAFNDLELTKLKSYSIPGHTDKKVSKILEHLGFKAIGTDTRGGLAPDGTYHDIVLYHMLKEWCRWI